MPRAQTVRQISRGVAAAPNLAPQPAAAAVPYSNRSTMTGNDMCDVVGFVLILYRGPVGKHMVQSPLRKVRNYGMHTNGDFFCVHADDAVTAPQLFEARGAVVEPEPGTEEFGAEGEIPEAPATPEPAPQAAPKERKQRKPAVEAVEVEDETED